MPTVTHPSLTLTTTNTRTTLTLACDVIRPSLHLDACALTSTTAPRQQRHRSRTASLNLRRLR